MTKSDVWKYFGCYKDAEEKLVANKINSSFKCYQSLFGVQNQH